eukprot:CAMPEP_0174738800 /NCGR_PEP_ID=MMETSP1094-20130205/70539_1 /TAXON_ID=156173 /ORGANISM="Chrysochromulina brevifilum, Strain UTEX LB 985" /LENGTH=159 /DNA_ID=CAMNT_0015942283 /DNA_START=428 /DNA_END=904 /DNA_ORIENTATION=-
MERRLLGSREHALSKRIELSQEIELSMLRSIEGAPSSDGITPPSLLVLKLSTLEDSLATAASELELLNTLANTNDLLSPVDSTGVRCALVSYRQEMRPVGFQAVAHSGPCGAAYDHLTLDGHALRGVVDAARLLGVDALWLDCWCYRPASAEYDHYDFC